MRKSLWMAAVVLGAAVQARAGAYMVYETTYNGKPPVTSRMSIGKDSMRVDVSGDKNASTVIFRGDKQVFWILNDKDKTYREMTKEDIERAAAKMDSAKAQMAERMKSMSPEEKAMMEKYMGGKMGAMAASATPKYVKKASGEKAGKWTADRYEAPGAKAGVRKLWAVPTGSFGLGPDDLHVMKEMSKFFVKFGTNQSDLFKFDANNLGFTGVPVKTETVNGGKVESTSEVKEVSHKDFSASTFDLPAGYAKKVMKGL